MSLSNKPILPYVATRATAKWGAAFGTLAYMNAALPSDIVDAPDAMFTMVAFSYMTGLVTHIGFVAGNALGESLEDNSWKRGNGVKHGPKGFAGALIGMGMMLSLSANTLTNWIANDFHDNKKMTKTENVQKTAPLNIPKRVAPVPAE